MTTFATSLVHFGILLGLRAAIREICMLDVVSQELFNCNSQYHRCSTKVKLRTVNALFRLTSFCFFMLYYVVQTAVCCLVYGVLPGVNIKYVLVEMVLVDLSCVFAQFLTLRYQTLHRAKKMIFFEKKYKNALQHLVRDGLQWTDVITMFKSRRFWFDITLFVTFLSLPYDVLSVAHCIFVHGCSFAFFEVKPAVSAVVVLGMDKKYSDEHLFPMLVKVEYAAKVANRVLQCLLLFKLVLSQSFSVLFFVYLAALPLLFDIIHVDLKLHLD